jgi:polysaccharide deacetylase family protein (PEP-CTERM system associated)
MIRSMINALTVDVEDWYTSSLALFDGFDLYYSNKPKESVVKNTRKVLEILREYGYKATFFVLATVAEHYPDLVREIHDKGHEVATHGYSHRLVYQMKPEEFEEDLVESIKLIEDIIKEKVVGYRAGYFSITKKSLWALDILLKHDVKYDSSIFPIRRRLYGIPDFPHFASVVKKQGNHQLWEIPPSTISFFGQNFPIGGGGYLRIFPYWVIRWGIKKLNVEGHSAVIYIHPYEIDPKDIEIMHSPRGWRTKFTLFTQRMNRLRFEEKIRMLFDDFKFGSIKEVFKF